MSARSFEPITGPDLARFWAKVALPDANGCLLWLASKDHHGYGQFRHGDRMIKTHRFAYTLLVGPVPSDLSLDHLCRVRHCLTPNHLEPVTHAENTRRGDAGRPQASRTHCPQGHPYSGENLYVTTKKGRMCRACHLDQGRVNTGYQGGPHNRDKTHCKRGHLLSDENLYVTTKGGRQCRACQRASKAAFLARRAVKHAQKGAQA